MKRAILILATLSITGCNVFFSLNSVEPDGNSTTNGSTITTNGATGGIQTCTASCTCSTECDVACEGACSVECDTGATCTGNVPDGSRVECGEDSSCMVSCTGGSCEFECAQQSSDCEIDCPDGVACVLDCGRRRNGTNRDDCGFSTCAAGESDCGDGIVTCGTACP